ncbi:Uncharacterised protein [Shigella sonnei]|nr:Uncharacterised protein [Shigella sonnei]CSE94835.1 Uncharacterised protein [Shigella sonnei]CSF09745.1 Uncharacterised protein [Shigella sonnei]CSF80498.1 Uncharacterised protein [Shigella sonnei]CSG30771.1 Uncharacterised protein [Shigella sonnei]
MTPNPAEASASAIPYSQTRPSTARNGSGLPLLAFTVGRGIANKMATSATPIMINANACKPPQ